MHVPTTRPATDRVQPSALDALPIVLATAGPAAARIRRLLEGELGWQALDGGPAALLVADVPGGLGAAADGRPSLLLVGREDDPLLAAEVVRRLRPDAVVSWPPDQAEQVRDAAAAALRRERPAGDEPDAPCLTVGGASGGVGTTTVALAVAGLRAWAGDDTIAVVHGAVPHPTGPTVDADALASPSLGAAFHPARGVPRLRVLRSDRPPTAAVVAGALTVIDRGVDLAVDLLVCRRDAPGLDAVAITPAPVVVVTDSGPVPWSALRRAAASRRLVLVPWSARVARAAALGRVPASLPGSWLAHLRPVVSGGPGRG